MDFLKGYPLFKWSINMFNDTIGVIYTLLGVSPMDGTYKEAWNMVSNLYNVFLGIGAPLLTIFFVWGFCRDALDLKAELQFEATVKTMFRYIFTVTAMEMFVVWFPLLCHMAMDLLGLVKEKRLKINAGDMARQISDNMTPMVGFVLALIFLLIAIACCVIMVWSVFGRFINMYMLIPFASIALSTIAGGGEIARTGYSYVKTMLVYVFEIVLMAVDLAIAGSFLMGSSVIDSGDNLQLVYVESIVKMVCIGAALKGCDATFRRAFNM